MEKMYKCSECGKEFYSAAACREHENGHKIDFELAFKILKQAKFDDEPCPACPRPYSDCDGCLEDARDIVVRMLEGLGKGLKKQIRNEIAQKEQAMKARKEQDDGDEDDEDDGEGLQDVR